MLIILPSCLPPPTPSLRHPYPIFCLLILLIILIILTTLTIIIIILPLPLAYFLQHSLNRWTHLWVE